MTKRQSGNVLFMILIAIFLLGGLTVLMSRTSGQSDDTGDKEKSSIYLSDVLRQAAFFQLAVSQLMLQGCSEGQLNFYDSTNSIAVINPNAPSDGRCDIFGTTGAGAPSDAQTGNPEEWVFSATKCVYGLGAGSMATCVDAQHELRAVIKLTKQECIQINRMVGVANTATDPPEDDEGTIPFDGSYVWVGGSYNSNTIGPSATALSDPLRNKKAACFMDNNGSGIGQYRFYYAILIR